MAGTRKLNGGKDTALTRRSPVNEARGIRRRTVKRQPRKEARLLGRYIIADPGICHGKPTFRGTRIMVWQVLEMVAEGMAWESIVEQWGGSVTKEAIAEAEVSSHRTGREVRI